jgi:GLPGLI family protein
MKHFYFLIFILSVTFSNAQKPAAAVKVTYGKSSNGKPVENDDKVIVFADAQRTVVTSKSIVAKKAQLPFEHSYFDRLTGFYHQSAQLSRDKTTLTTDSTAIAGQSFEKLPDTKTILGYNCMKAKTVINSNTIELWYTTDLGFSGAPGILGQNLGLVLEVTRNNNFTILAEKVEKIKAIPSAVIPSRKKAAVDLLTYRDQLWKSRFTTIPIFRNETINFSDNYGSNDSVFRFAKGTVIMTGIRIPEIKKGSRVFLEVHQKSNGDAYDRTGSVFLIPTDRKLSFLDGLRKSVAELPVYDNGNGKQYQGVVRTKDYSPLIELMRFFTPFGIGQYNTIKLKGKTWQDSMFYRQEISKLAPMLSGREVWIGANISNYDKGGHKISASITIHPEEDQASETTGNFVMPLFDTTCVLETAGQQYPTMFDNDKGLEVEFELAAPLKNASLRYITSGHGGWENGDEFVPRKNTILLDGNEVAGFIPWRTDCGSFRSYNPASGNFSNGLSSSDYSRSNWCPGTTVNPVYIDLGNLEAGKHIVQVKIPQGAPEGTSFSSWNVSGLLLGQTTPVPKK